MDPNPYQSPHLESTQSVRERASGNWSKRISFVAGILAITGVAVVFSGALAVVWGPGAAIAAALAFIMIYLNTLLWPENNGRRWITIAVCSILIISCGLLSHVPLPVTVACVFFGCSISITRFWFLSVREQNLLGLKLFNQGRIEKAYEVFDRVLQRDPHFYDSLVNRAVCNVAVGRLDQARYDLDEAIRLRPDLQVGFAHRGQLQIRLESWDAAISDLQTALKTTPEDAELRYLVAFAHFGKGDAVRARAEVDELLHVASVRSRAYVLRARIHVTQYAHVSAIADFESAVAIDASFIEAWSEIGRLSATSHDPNARNAARALSAAKRACELTNWNNFVAISVLAAAHAEAGDFDQAVR